MRVVLLASTFSKNMGYLENMLPRHLARAGADMHVIAMDLPPYYWMPESRATYGDFAQNSPAGTTQQIDGFTLHIVGHQKIAGYMRMVGLEEKLAALQPDIVQCSAVIGWIPLDAALYRFRFGYRLFSGNHYHASVFPLAQKQTSWWNPERLRCTVTRSLPGWLVSLVTEKCYAIAPDCADVAARFFGVPREKIEICPLGVDTQLFHPVMSDEDLACRRDLRSRLGFTDSDIVCIYSGRFSQDKNPRLLAQAVAELVSQGKPFRGLFVGKGSQQVAIAESAGCRVHDFVPVRDLGKYFRAADIAVWPTQESLSMLDAAACGLPVVVNQTVSARERIEGNGLFYQLGDVHDLVRLLDQLGDAGIRRELGDCGAGKMEREFSWGMIAERRLRDYEAALNRERGRRGVVTPVLCTEGDPRFENEAKR